MVHENSPLRTVAVYILCINWENPNAFYRQWFSSI